MTSCQILFAVDEFGKYILVYLNDIYNVYLHIHNTTKEMRIFFLLVSLILNKSMKQEKRIFYWEYLKQIIMQTNENN